MGWVVKVVQPNVMESGPTLNRDQQPIMIDKVTTEDIYNALLKIQDNKALEEMV